MKQDKQWLLYGAYGYTGELIARQAVKAGLHPVLAGRDKTKTAELAAELGLTHVVFSLSDLAENNGLLNPYNLVLNCAGPFSQTAEVFLDACMRIQCHYFDITGEIAVFEAAAERHQQAVLADVILCPGIGFDVIPTDCMAALLKRAMPDATHLSLGFDSRSGFSPGTAKTSVEALPEGGRIREDGLVKQVPLAYKTRRIDFGGGQKLAMTIPWGDVATAYYSTEIPNIEVYIPGSPKLIKRLKRMNWIRPILAWSWVQNILKKRIEKTVRGPDKETREKLTTFVWGEVTNAAGERMQKRLQVSNGYQLTADGALYVIKTVLKQADVSPGYHTPSTLLGCDLIYQLPGTRDITVS